MTLLPYILPFYSLQNLPNQTKFKLFPKIRIIGNSKDLENMLILEGRAS
ncbi:MAG: hypothetical protein NTU73_09935 [Ignavibacteriae bacterium]|nr:hypothetical protein [Ignavibacteriota bacterium]